jgi:hypothetical protein
MNRPWYSEDNKVDFEADSLRCCMRRGPLGSWCGYVGIPKSHPWWGKGYNDYIKPTADMLGPRDVDDHGAIDLLCQAWSGKDATEELSVGLAMRVHGGLTYARDHEPYGKPDGLWWFGFDCAHSGDLIPSFAEGKYGAQDGDIYRDQQYVVAECQSLAAQLLKVSS